MSDATAAPLEPRRPRLSHWLEYAALRGFLGGLAPLGVRGASAVAGAIARLGHTPFGIRRGVVERQVAAAFPEFSPRDVRCVALESYENLGRVAVEASILARRGPSAVLDVFGDSPEWAVAERAYAEGKGVAFIAGHLGNWELSGAYLAARGVQVYPIARGMSNPLSEAFFTRTRERLGMHVMHDRESVRRVPRIFRDGGAVGFLSDQATVGLASTVVPFFGRPAKTPRGAAVFALRAGVPLILIHAIRHEDGRYRFHAEELAVTTSGDREKDVDDIVRRFSEALERLVRRYPGQYFWQHRRWKHQPLDTPAHLREP